MVKNILNVELMTSGFQVLFSNQPLILPLVFVVSSREIILLAL